MKYDWQKNLFSPRGITYCIYWLPLKANEFNGVDNTCFPSIFVRLMYLFIFVDFLKLY